MKFTLNTSRLMLRPLSTNDLTTTHKYASDLNTTKYMYYLPNHNIGETLAFLHDAEMEWSKANPEFYEFAICLDGDHIGAVSLSHVEDDRYELGWIVDKHYQGHGYATEAARELVKLAKTLDAKQVIAHCDTRNIASRRVMEKIGMTFVLEQKRQYLDERGIAKEYMYSMKLE